ncbi:MAG: 3-hydroxyacyl-CoA dehydrogenase NAD-binding protein, partial [Deltaproteobacteria bacterium]|nr:3-hydroxyacyl-CoA dehydrogenase NAD-binding protein [Deltaproteobacteria bacterium]
MKLLEIVPGPDTLPEVVDTLVEICEKIVGKGIVYAKDTPNFVANRIGIYSMLCCVRTMMDLGLTIEAVDELTGPVVGHPKSASFRTADLVGLDTIIHVANNVYEGAVGDEKREMFQMPDFIKQMTEKKLLGDKTKQGFYKRVEDNGKKDILSIDYKTLAYKPQQKTRFASLEAAKSVPGTAGKMKALYFADDLAGQFSFRTLSDMLVYSAMRIPEIADDIVNVDNAMKWGFAWKMGPFEAWDAVGVEGSVVKMKKAGFEIPG